MDALNALPITRILSAHRPVPVEAATKLFLVKNSVVPLKPNDAGPVPIAAVEEMLRKKPDRSTPNRSELRRSRLVGRAVGQHGAFRWHRENRVARDKTSSCKASAQSGAPGTRGDARASNIADLNQGVAHRPVRDFDVLSNHCSKSIKLLRSPSPGLAGGVNERLFDLAVRPTTSRPPEDRRAGSSAPIEFRSACTSWYKTVVQT